MRITIGRVVSILVVAAAGAGIVWALLPHPILVETTMVQKGRFVASIDEDGKTRIRERYLVTAPLGGRLARIRLKAGDRVGINDVIATIVPSPAPLLDPRSRRQAEERLGAAEAELDRVKAVVERASAQAEQAKTDLDRARTLFGRGASTTQAVERAELVMRLADRDLRAAEFQKHAAEHEIDQARALLVRYLDDANVASDTWTVRAPVPGEVLKIAQESETIVQPGAPLIEIGDPHDLEIVVDVLSTDSVEIRPGADVTIDHWGGPGLLSGRVRRVEPGAITKISTLGVEEQRVNVLVDISTPPQQWTGLGDAFQLDARIIVFTQDDATIVPTGALFRRGETWNVYVVTDGKVQEREITLLRRSGRFAAASAGISPGERVIVYPNDRVVSGIRVEVR